MLKSCIQFAGIVLLALPSSSGGMVAPDHAALYAHPSNARLAKILAANNLTNSMAPAERIIILPKPAVIAKNVCRRVPDRYAPCPVAEIDADLYRIVEKEANRVGISPLVLLAIEVHESGAYRSRLWRTSNNPGGIEYRHFQTVNCRRAGRWAAFDSPEDGIRAHAEVLSHGRYDRARATKDPFVQVAAIAAAGYCEPGYNWGPQVKKHLRRLIAKNT